MGSITHLYETFSKLTHGESRYSEGMPKIPPLPNFTCEAEPETAEFRIFQHQLRKQKDDFQRDMAEYTAKMERLYRKSEGAITNSTQGYRIKSYGFIVSTWVTREMLNIKIKLKPPKTKVTVIMKRCLKRKFRMEIINPDYEVAKWLFIKTPWAVYAKDLKIVRNCEEDDDSIIIQGPVVVNTNCMMLY